MVVLLKSTVNTEIAFETGAFAVTQEIWKAAANSLGIDNKEGTHQITRLGPNQIQIIQYEELGQKNPFESSKFQKTKVIAEFIAQAQGDKKIWRKK